MARSYTNPLYGNSLDNIDADWYQRTGIGRMSSGLPTPGTQDPLATVVANQRATRDFSVPRRAGRVLSSAGMFDKIDADWNVRNGRMPGQDQQASSPLVSAFGAPQPQPAQPAQPAAPQPTGYNAAKKPYNAADPFHLHDQGSLLGLRKGTARVPGKGNKDTVPAMLTPGEAVLNKGAAKALGRGKIAKLNAKHADGKKTGFRSGKLHAAAGYVNPHPPGSAAYYTYENAKGGADQTSVYNPTAQIASARNAVQPVIDSTENLESVKASRAAMGNAAQAWNEGSPLQAGMHVLKGMGNVIPAAGRDIAAGSRAVAAPFIDAGQKVFGAPPAAKPAPMTAQQMTGAMSDFDTKSSGDPIDPKTLTPGYYDKGAASNGADAVEARKQGLFAAQMMNDPQFSKTVGRHGGPNNARALNDNGAAVVTMKDGHKVYTNRGTEGIAGKSRGETPEAAAAAKQASKDFWEQNARLDAVRQSRFDGGKALQDVVKSQEEGRAKDALGLRQQRQLDITEKHYNNADTLARDTLNENINTRKQTAQAAAVKEGRALTDKRLKDMDDAMLAKGLPKEKLTELREFAQANYFGGKDKDGKKIPGLQDMEHDELLKHLPILYDLFGQHEKLKRGTLDASTVGREAKQYLGQRDYKASDMSTDPEDLVPDWDYGEGSNRVGLRDYLRTFVPQMLGGDMGKQMEIYGRPGQSMEDTGTTRVPAAAMRGPTGYGGGRADANMIRSTPEERQAARGLRVVTPYGTF